MLLKAWNRSLIKDREVTYLTSAVTATSTAITVASTDINPAGSASNTWANNDYMIIGKLGEEGTEIMQVAAAISSATSMTIDREGSGGGLRHAHPAFTPIYRIDFNRVQFYRGATNSTTALTTLATARLQPDEEFTRYDDTANTTGYGFIRFENETTGAFSAYSGGVNYEEDGELSSRDPHILFNIRKRVRKLLNIWDEDKLPNEDIDDSANDAQRDLAHMRLWSFFEIERSFSSVANQFRYPLPGTIQTIHTARFDTQPLIPLNRQSWDTFHWDQNVSSADPTHAHIWNRELLVYPRPSASAQTTAINDAAGITATATSVTVDSTSGFNRGDYYRFIIDSEVIYATASTTTAFTGLRRGMEGTTAAAHADNATITERDIVYTAHVEPTDMLDPMDETPVPEPDILAYMAAIDLAPEVDREDRIPVLEGKRDKKIAALEQKYGSKLTGSFSSVKDASMVIQDSTQILNPNLFPRDLS